MKQRLTSGEIARIIDPDNTFLSECNKVMKWRKQVVKLKESK